MAKTTKTVKTKKLSKRPLSRKGLIKKYDDTFRDFILLRDNWTCVLCGKSTKTAGHVISRKYYAVRWDPENVYAQCSGCNLAHVYTPHLYINWVINTKGLNCWNSLCARIDTYKTNGVTLTDSKILANIEAIKRVTEIYKNAEESEIIAIIADIRSNGESL